MQRTQVWQSWPIWSQAPLPGCGVGGAAHCRPAVLLMPSCVASWPTYVQDRRSGEEYMAAPPMQLACTPMTVYQSPFSRQAVVGSRNCENVPPAAGGSSDSGLKRSLRLRRGRRRRPRAAHAPQAAIDRGHPADHAPAGRARTRAAGAGRSRWWAPA